MLRGLLYTLWVLALGGLGTQATPPWPVTDRTAGPMHASVYVWHESWPPGLAEQAGLCARHFAGWVAEGPGAPLWIKTAELQREGDGYLVRAASVDWAALAEALGDQPDAAGPTHVWLVARLDERGAPLDRPDAAIDELAAHWRATADRIADLAPGLAVTGVQLDFDCPSRRLGDYANLLKKLRTQIDPAWRLSITALPAWLDRPSFVRVTRACDLYVLQVHALRPPKRVDDVPPLVEPARALRWVEQAARLGRPFAVSLPTYSVQLRFDDQGRFVNQNQFAARGDRALRPGEREVELKSDAQAISELVTRWRSRRPVQLVGLAWFRLAEPGAELAWSGPALRAVAAGRPPLRAVQLVVREPRPGLLEVVVQNQGETSETVGASIRVDGLSSGVAQGSGGVFRDSPVGWVWRADGGALRLDSDGADALRLGPGREAVMMWASAPGGAPLTGPAGPSAAWVDSDDRSSQRKEPWRGTPQDQTGTGSP
ncbi:MAG: DUF3142 domain-containing protein [Planctomycetota bacterium]